MRSIDRSRSVDAICAAQSYQRISIRDSVNCQSREQTEKINASIDFLTNILRFSTRKCPAAKCRKINVSYLFYFPSKKYLHVRIQFFGSGILIQFFRELSEQILVFVKKSRIFRERWMEMAEFSAIF